MKKLLWFCVLMMVCSLAAAAQETPRAEVFAGYSYMRSSIIDLGFNYQGGSAAVAFNTNHWFGMVGDFGGYHTNSHGVNVSQLTYMVGPRVSLRRRSRFTPFAQVLLGGSHLNTTYTGAAGTSNAFAASAGSGVDAVITSRFSVRVAQVDYIFTKFVDGIDDRQNSIRVSTGLVIHF